MSLGPHVEDEIDKRSWELLKRELSREKDSRWKAPEVGQRLGCSLGTGRGQEVIQCEVEEVIVKTLVPALGLFERHWHSLSRGGDMVRCIY